ncbi:MAG: putative esterase, partial [Rhodothermales bacterium]
MPALFIFFALFASASEIRLDAPNTTHGFVSVNIPDGAPPAEGHPVCFWYHGTGGHPNTGPLRWRGHPDMIAVGMAYAHKNDTIEGRARNNWAECMRVIEQVAKKTKVDRARVFVGGFSRGGWMAASIADMRPAGLRGAIIGGAGKSGEMLGRGGKTERPLAILVLVGEIDENFSASQEALRYFRGIGADVHYEEFRRQGHVLQRTPRIHNWLHVHLGSPDPAA